MMRIANKKSSSYYLNSSIETRYKNPYDTLKYMFNP